MLQSPSGALTAISFPHLSQRRVVIIGPGWQRGILLLVPKLQFGNVSAKLCFLAATGGMGPVPSRDDTEGRPSKHWDKAATELRRQVRSQTEFRNEGARGLT